MSFMHSIDRGETIFGAIYETLDKVENSNTFKAAHGAIKKAIVNVNNIAKKGCFGLKFIKEISLERYEQFLKTLKIKARDATGIVPSIDSCVLQEIQPMGFRRMIRMGTHQGIQRVCHLDLKKYTQVQSLACSNFQSLYFIVPHFF